MNPPLRCWPTTAGMPRGTLAPVRSRASGGAGSPRPPLWPRRGIRGLLLLLITLLVAGCSGLVTTSEVRPGLDVNAPEGNRIQVNFPPPAPGASTEQIARGFIRAGSASGGEYTSAKEFLTPELARTWAPDAEIVVFASDTAVDVRSVATDQVEVTASVVAVIGADGRYTIPRSATKASAAMTFVQVKGEWRISALPKGFGRWIPVADLHRLLQPFSVYYVARDRRSLIPDVHWLPLDHLPSRLARAQLSPVPVHLDGVADTAVEAGTRLTADSVTVVSGVATVDLSSRPATDRRARENLWAQFAATLTQDPSVIGVVVQVGGAVLELTDGPIPVTAPSDVGFPDPPVRTPVSPLVRRGTSLYVFDPNAAMSGRDPDKLAQDPAPGYPRVPVSDVDLALSANGDEIAAVTQDRSTLVRWRGGSRYEVPSFATSLTPPRYDTRGNLWIGGVALPGSSSPGARVWFLNAASDPGRPDGVTPRPLDVDWLLDRRVTEAVASPGGELLAIRSTSQTGTDARIEVAGILRDTNGDPRGLAAPLGMGLGLTSVGGLVWLDGTTVATLAKVGEKDAPQPYILGLAGDRTALTAVEGARRIVSTGGVRGIEIVTDQGQVRTRAGQQWITSGTGTDLLVAAG